MPRVVVESTLLEIDMADYINFLRRGYVKYRVTVKVHKRLCLVSCFCLNRTLHVQSEETLIALCKSPMFQSEISVMSNEDTDIDSMITTFNTAVTETAGEILGKHRQKKKIKKKKK